MALFDRVITADIELKSGEILRIRGLRVEFEIEKAGGSTPNKAEIKITNLSQRTRDKIREKDALIRVFAGYSGDIGATLLFVGNSSHIVHKWETPDIVTHIEALDGQQALRETRVSFVYANKTSINTIVTRLANDLGLPLRLDFIITGHYQGFSFNGMAKDAMDIILKNAKYTWSVQDNEIQVLSKDGDTGVIAVKLTPTTGLVNQPEKMNTTEGQLEEALSKELEWKITSLLNPRLTPGGLVELQSKQATGLFKIAKVRHFGDSRGKNWHSEIEVKPR